MTQSIRRAAVLLILVAATVGPVQADECLNGQSELNVLFAELVEASRTSGYSASNPQFAAELESIAHTIESSGAGRIRVEQMIETGSAMEVDYLNRVRWDRSEFDFSGLESMTSADLVALVERTKTIVNRESVGLAAHLLVYFEGDFRKASDELCAMREFSELDLQFAFENNLRSLRRYEKKFGPQSPRLNWVEAGLNVLAANTIKGFGPNGQGDPGPLEVIAAYSSSYVSRKDDQYQVTSVLEVGLRGYLFKDGWGENDGYKGMLQPGYWSIGGIMAGAEDGPLEFLEGHKRFGLFAAWGSVKVAYLLGNDGETDRWLVSKQFQFIPTLF